MLRYNVKSIKEKVPEVTILPDGLYYGTWSGHVINLEYKNKNYELITEEGVKDFGRKVVVEVKNGVATFDKVMK